MNIAEIVSQNEFTFIIMAVVIVLSTVVNIMRLKKFKKENATLLDQSPDAAKVFLTTKMVAVSGAVSVSLVNGTTPHFFVEGGKTGFYAPHGIVDVEMTYTKTRPGLAKRTVTTTYGPTTKKLELSPYGQYILGFDTEEETFTFKTYSE